VALVVVSATFGSTLIISFLTVLLGHFAAWVWTLFIGLELLSASFIAGALLRTEPH
jgi:hypothetical protein